MSCYESNGYTYAYISEGKVTADNGYYPQAGRNFLAGVRDYGFKPIRF